MKMTRTSFSAPMKAIACAALGSALLVVAMAGRFSLEQTMARHMLVQIPMLLVAGAAFNRCFVQLPRMRAFARRFASWDEYGLTGLSMFLLVTAFWMIPKALDGAIASLAMEQGKFASLFFAGLLLPTSLPRANIILQLFFLGNFASMMAIVGMLYQDAPKRLCNFYLMDDQVLAGTLLVVLAFVIPLLWCLSVKAVRDTLCGRSPEAALQDVAA